MKKRHKTRGDTQIKRGKTARQVSCMASRLNVPFKTKTLVLDGE